MPFLTIRQILAKVEAFHAAFGERLHEAEGLAQNGEARMLLHFLANHERELADVLAAMEHDDENDIATLEEWVQFDAGVDDPREYLSQFHVAPDAAPRDVLRAANRLDVCLFCLYKGLAKGGSTPRAQRLFARLARMELDHQKAKGDTGTYY